MIEYLGGVRLGRGKPLGECHHQILLVHTGSLSMTARI
jgi:hypothetical protein